MQHKGAPSEASFSDTPIPAPGDLETTTRYTHVTSNDRFLKGGKPARASCSPTQVVGNSGGEGNAMRRAETSAPPIHSSVAPGFEEVRHEFERNFRERGEWGAACAIYHRGEPVVDLWGGWRDAQR